VNVRAPSDDGEAPEPHASPLAWIPARVSDVPVRARCTALGTMRHDFVSTNGERLRLWDKLSHTPHGACVDTALSVGVQSRCTRCGVVVWCEALVPVWIDSVSTPHVVHNPCRGDKPATFTHAHCATITIDCAPSCAMCVTLTLDANALRAARVRASEMWNAARVVLA
jgi:hypothetical protein